MDKRIVFWDAEATVKTRRIRDIGAVDNYGAVFHSAHIESFVRFLNGADFVCGHNLIHHDFEILQSSWGRPINIKAIDTLYWSPLLFPQKPYHALVKDDKIVTDQLNNPVNDSRKAKDLLEDEIAAFRALPTDLKKIFYSLLSDKEECNGLFDYLQFEYYGNVIEELIRTRFVGKICSNAPLSNWIKNKPIELAYALAVINTGDRMSIAPKWVQVNFPEIDNVMHELCNNPCDDGCP